MPRPWSPQRIARRPLGRRARRGGLVAARGSHIQGTTGSVLRTPVRRWSALPRILGNRACGCAVSCTCASTRALISAARLPRAPGHETEPCPGPSPAGARGGPRSGSGDTERRPRLPSCGLAPGPDCCALRHTAHYARCGSCAGIAAPGGGKEPWAAGTGTVGRSSASGARERKGGPAQRATGARDRHALLSCPKPGTQHRTKAPFRAHAGRSGCAYMPAWAAHPPGDHQVAAVTFRPFGRPPGSRGPERGGR